MICRLLSEMFHSMLIPGIQSMPVAKNTWHCGSAMAFFIGVRVAVRKRFSVILLQIKTGVNLR
jgi:hypothetical protein